MPDVSTATRDRLVAWRSGAEFFGIDVLVRDIDTLIAEHETLANDLARERMDQVEFDRMADRLQAAEAKVAAVAALVREAWAENTDDDPMIPACDVRAALGVSDG